MPDLRFKVEGAAAVPYSTSPLIAFQLRVTNANPEESIQSIALRCQIQIDVTQRKYNAIEQERMLDLFDVPERWSRTLRPLLWTHTSVTAPPFKGSTIVELPVPCTFDFNVASTKYFAALGDGEVPLNLMFSGTVFYEATDGGLLIEQIPWDRETKYRLPVRVWREMMDLYYPNSAWLCLQRDLFERLTQYKMDHGIPTWEQAFERLLDSENGLNEKKPQITQMTQIKSA